MSSIMEIMGKKANTHPLKPMELHLIIPKPLMDDLDEWRRRQPDLPNRSEAIRTAITNLTKDRGVKK